MKKIFLLLLIPFAMFAQNRTTVFDKYMQTQTNLYQFNGNVLVAKNGKVIYKQSFGFADLNTRIKLDSSSIFDCGSIAKEFTAVGILLLKDKGLISYTDTLRKFFPELPYPNITVQQLLTHSSGMPDGFGLVTKFFDHNKIASNADMIRLLASEKPPTYFKPGEDLMYSGTAFIMLASIIEKISGQSYNAYMKEHIFKPLGMDHTNVVNGPRSVEQIPGFAYGFVYSEDLKKYVRADSMLSGWTSYLSGFTGEGMIISTTGDLLKWDHALRNHSLLTEITQKEMLSTQFEKKTFPFVCFGYGIRVGKNDLGNYIFHNGSYPGYEGMLIRYTDDDVTIVVLSNNESHSDYIADALAAIVLNKNFIMSYAHNKTDANTVIDTYLGKYMMPLLRPPYMVAFPIELIKKDEKLFVHSGGGDDIELKPESKTKFFFDNNTDQQIEFETENNGNLIKAWYIGWGLKKEMKKID